MDKNPALLTTKVLNATVIVTALGYLVDMYDFFIFNITRVASLSDLHLSGEALTRAGLMISNCQLGGILLGGYLWGVMGDKLGRKSCLFASILTYSLATLSCSLVQSVDHYAFARFLAGFGLAGELGIGLTLVSEKLMPLRRGMGTMFFITLGCIGVLLAALAATLLSWRTAYLIGGIFGLALLLARILVFESGLYEKTAQRVQERGGLKIIVRTPLLLKKYVSGILLLSIASFIPQLVWTLSPELAKAQGIAGDVRAPMILALGYICTLPVNLLACFLSEKQQSRKKPIMIFFILTFILFLKYLFWPAASLAEFYIINGLLGVCFGVWLLTGTLVTEQFGTNIRATAATTTPNCARALVIPMNLLFAQLKPLYGSQTAVGIIGLIVFACAFWGWLNVDETYGKDIDYIEV
jgi:putative MFS transporter